MPVDGHLAAAFRQFGSGGRYVLVILALGVLRLGSGLVVNRLQVAILPGYHVALVAIGICARIIERTVKEIIHRAVHIDLFRAAGQVGYKGAYRRIHYFISIVIVAVVNTVIVVVRAKTGVDREETYRQHREMKTDGRTPPAEGMIERMIDIRAGIIERAIAVIRSNKMTASMVVAATTIKSTGTVISK